MEVSSEYSLVCIKQCATEEFLTAEEILLIEIHHQIQVAFSDGCVSLGQEILKLWSGKSWFVWSSTKLMTSDINTTSADL